MSDDERLVQEFGHAAVTEYAAGSRGASHGVLRKNADQLRAARAALLTALRERGEKVVELEAYVASLQITGQITAAALAPTP